MPLYGIPNPPYETKPSSPDATYTILHAIECELVMG